MWVKVVVLPRAVLPVTRNKAIQMRTIILPWYHFRGFFNNQRNIHSVSMRFATFLFGCCASLLLSCVACDAKGVPCASHAGLL